MFGKRKIVAARTGAVMAGLLGLSACATIPVVEQGSPTWYGVGTTVDQLDRAAAQCEPLAADSFSPVVRSCMSRYGIHVVHLPDCSPEVRAAALAQGPSGRTVMPPLAPGACIMRLPNGAEPIISDPSEYV